VALTPDTSPDSRKTGMLFSDAKRGLSDITSAIKALVAV
jgi:hypothetical protein